MPDRYNIEIRRICEADKDCNFKSHLASFDRFNESGTLLEYWVSDTQCKGGGFSVYLLTEMNSKIPIGMLRIRDELSGADASIPELRRKPAIYLSRFAILKHKRDYHLGRVLMEYLFFIAKSKMREHSLTEIIIYLKSVKNEDLIGYYKSFGAVVIKEISEKHWGAGVVMSTVLELKDEL